MKGRTRSPAIRRALDRARAAGYRVEFLPEPVALLPGTGCVLPPMGHCDYTNRVIRVATGTDRRPYSREMIAAILEHEVEHAEGARVASSRPEFGLFCGNHGEAA